MRKRGFWTGVMLAGLALILASGGLVVHNVLEERQAGEASNEILLQIAQAMPSQSNAGAQTSPGAQTEEPVQEAEQTPETALPAASGVAREQEQEGQTGQEATDLPMLYVEGLGYMGVISIPSLNIELPVLGEWEFENLKTAPCRYYGSFETHDLVICAHNYSTHFGPLRNIQIGEKVQILDASGMVHTYTVAATEILSPLATKDVISGQWDLTLFTCTVGGRTRMIVRCDSAEQ